MRATSLLACSMVLAGLAPARADELRPGYLELTQRDAAHWKLVWKAPILVLGIADARGIDGEPKIALDGQTMPLRRGTRLGDADGKTRQDAPYRETIPIGNLVYTAETNQPLPAYAGGIRTGFSAVGAQAHHGKSEKIPFKIEVNLIGTGSLSFTPLGETTTADLRGDWPHPSFGGNYLPRSREIDQNGFSAHWSTSALAADSEIGSFG